MVRNKLNVVLLFSLLAAILSISIVSAEVLVLNLNSAEYSVGESAKIFGYVYDDTYTGIDSAGVDVYLDDTFIDSTTASDSGYYEYFLTSLTEGTHNLTVNTSSSTSKLSFTVFPQETTPSYKILASSLTVPYRDPELNLTIKKFLGETLTDDDLELKVYYSNGTLYETVDAVSGVEETLTLPSAVGMYSVKIDNKKSFMISVSKFDLKFNIVDVSGNFENEFKPGAIAYFEVEGFSNGQKLTNATVTAQITTPQGNVRTIPFVEDVGLYLGNTNVTQAGSALSLVAGDYEVEFIMKDSSNNEQRVKGFFTVFGLSIDVDLLSKKPYITGEEAEFDIIVRDLEDGTLINHSDVTYSFELMSDGNLYEFTGFDSVVHPDITMTSLASYLISEDLDDGGYILEIEAESDGKIGFGKEFIEVRNNELFVEFTDNFGGWREFFQPGEMIKVTTRSDENISNLTVNVYDKSDVLQLNANTSGESTTMSVTFNAPSVQQEYVAEIVAIVDGEEVYEDRWFSVQNYHSFMDVKNSQNEFQYIIGGDEAFLAEIRVFDISEGQGVDLSNFKVKFDKLVNEETQIEYTNFNVVENETLSNRATGVVVYNVDALNLPNGPYKLEYTLVNENGKSFKGKGWFGISAFNVEVTTYGETGQRKEVFSPGATINVSVNVGEDNGTATIHRDFFDEKTFNITDGSGWTLLTAANNELPSESGWYPFGVEVDFNGETGIGDAWFEIRSLNFRSINLRDNGKFAPDDSILVDLVVEKSGTLINDTNVTIERLFRSYDMQEISFTSTANLTDSSGRTTLNLTPLSSLEPGHYFADMRAEKANDRVYAGFGFEIVSDEVSISLEDEDRSFSSTDSIAINVLVTGSDGSPKANIPVVLESLLNLNTWGDIQVGREANTSSNGIASFSLAASSYNPSWYAPVVNVTTLDNNIVGFGESEFEIRPFDSSIDFVDFVSSFSTSDDILVNVTVIGDVTVTSTCEDMYGESVDIDYYYSNGILTLNNNFFPGEYYLDVTIASGAESKTKRLWFEIIAPWASMSMENNWYRPDGTLEFDYSVFTFGFNGWSPSSGTIIMTQVENLWDNEFYNVSVNFSANGEGSETLDLSTIEFPEGVSELPTGDYFLHFEIDENPDYSESLYFRIDKDVNINYNIERTNRDVNLTIEVAGLSGDINYTVVEIHNFHNWENEQLNELNQNGLFEFTDLENGWYQVQFEVSQGDEVYSRDAHFDVWVHDVEILAPDEVFVGEETQFNISSSIESKFWIMQPYTDTVLVKRDISAGDVEEMYTFEGPGRYMYGFGNERWDIWQNAREVNVRQQGFDVEWPFDKWRYISGIDNLTFNVTTAVNDSPIFINFRSHFTGEESTVDLGSTPHTEVKTEYNIPLSLTGPQDIELIVEPVSGAKLKEFFFVDVFPTRYDAWAWTDQWEYNAGDTITVRTEVYDIVDDTRLSPDDVSIAWMDNPGGVRENNPTISFTPGNDYFEITTDENWLTGHYHSEVNFTVDGTQTYRGIPFFVRGNDNLELYTYQNQWDVTSADNFELTVEAWDSGERVEDVPVTLMVFETRPDNWEEEPENVTLTSYTFSTDDNATDFEGKIVFTIDISEESLSSGGYSGRLNVGGQVVWFDFMVRSYQIDSYTEEWEHGLTDAIELNIRARDITTWDPILEDGNVTIENQWMMNTQDWQREEINLSALSLSNTTFEVVNGEALIEMQINTTEITLDGPYEFELEFSLDISSGEERGFGRFRVSNTEKPTLTLVNGAGTEPDTIFPNQNYTLQLTGPENMSAMLRNMWGPNHRNFDREFTETNGTLSVEFTTPNMPGYYTVEVEVEREEGWYDWMNADFMIGSGTSLEGKMDGNVIPGVNFTLDLYLEGEGNDPFCPTWNRHCSERQWFGPLGNKTVILSGFKDMSDFSYTNLSNLNINGTTDVFESWMMWLPEPDEWYFEGECNGYQDSSSCDEQEFCYWLENNGGFECQTRWELCRDFDQSECDSNSDCIWEVSCNVNLSEYQNEMPGDEEGGHHEFVQPGKVEFTIDPDIIGLESGKNYDLIFSYFDSQGEEYEGKIFTQVEDFHVGISRLVENLAPNSDQPVWIKTAYLNGSSISGCQITFDAVYSRKDYEKVKSLSIQNVTDVNGEMTFTYTAPSMPGEYFVNGNAFCEIDGENKTQDIAYFIDVGSRNLEIDLSSQYEPGENIVIAISTTDRLGEPKSQSLDIELMHWKDHENNVFPEGGIDCTYLEAGPENWGMSDGGSNNMMHIQTDEEGVYELELCPMPLGSYDLRVFPVFDNFDEGPMEPGKHGDGDFGFFGVFSVSSFDFSVESDQISYMVGEEVNYSILVTDEFGNRVNGTILAIETAFELLAEEEFEMDLDIDESEGTIELINGEANYQFTIPPNATNAKDGEVHNVTFGPTFVRILVQDSDDQIHDYETMPFFIQKSAESFIEADDRVYSNSLIQVNVTTDDNLPYKVLMGAFILKENAESEKMWEISNGIFFENGTGDSSASFKILTPKEPGHYYLGMPILPLSASFAGGDPMEAATEMMMTPIEVILDSVNVTGKIIDKDGSDVEGALISIGKSTAISSSEGTFYMVIPKGTKSVIVEKKEDDLKYFMQTDKLGFQDNKELNITLYELGLSGSLVKTLFNITSPAYDLSTTKLRINVTLNNTGNKGMNNLSLTGIAMSGEESYNPIVEAFNTTSVFFSRLYAGFENDDYKLRIIAKDPEATDSYVTLDGVSVNSTIGSSLIKRYEVITYATPGNGLNDDGDNETDEEIDNNQDDDDDGLIDEDLEAVEYSEYCGNGYCSPDEYENNGCFIDCSHGSACGDGNCDSDETFNCAEDCEGESDFDPCDSPGMCLDGLFCNPFSFFEPADHCEVRCDTDNCWACDVDECTTREGCVIIEEEGNDPFCDFSKDCSDDACHFCGNETTCTNTTSCEWRVDEFNSENQWCDMAWDCSLNCPACNDESACGDSPAFMGDADGCVWITDPFDNHQFCDWNFTHMMPPGEGGEGIIFNFWLVDDINTPDWNSTEDYMNYSDNRDEVNLEGEYFLMMELGSTNVSVTVDGVEWDTIDNFGNQWRTLNTSTAWDFSNGTFEINVKDLLGPDNITWTVTFGNEEVSEDCGNDVVDQGEQCDGDNLDSQSCTSEQFQGVYDGGVLACNGQCQFDVSSCSEVPVEQGSLAGFVYGSIITDANVTIWGSLGQTYVESDLTDETGWFNTTVDAGLYDVELFIPNEHDFEAYEIYLTDVNISGHTYLNFMVPHLYYDVYLDEVANPELWDVENGNPFNFSLEVNNTEIYDINATLFVDASNIGQESEYADEVATILGGTAQELGYTIGVSASEGETTISYELEFEIPFESVINASDPNVVDSSELIIGMIDLEQALNVSGEGQAGDPCENNINEQTCTAADCGWGGPPGEEECGSCMFAPVEFCEGIIGCTWDVDHCVSEGEE